MKNVIKFIAVVVVFAFVACSDSDSENLGGISNTPLEGKVFGTSFKATGGKAFSSGNQVSVNITNVVADCNSTIFDYDLYISTTVDNGVGSSNKTNVVFNKKGETPLNVIQSTVTVESITLEEVKIKIKSNSSSNNTIEGTFTVPFCK